MHHLHIHESQAEREDQVNWYLVSGVVVVIGLALATVAPLVYGIWDLVRIRRGENLGVTASNWFTAFLMRHPVVGIAGGLALGILIGHLAWFQVVRICP